MADKTRLNSDQDQDLGEGMERSTPPAAQSTGEPMFRYACEACTGIAYYSASDKLTTHPEYVCKNCGSVLGSVKPENFIPLTISERESLAAL